MSWLYKCENKTRDIYRRYRQDIARRSEGCDYATFAKILRDFNKELSRVILEESEIINLPFRLGKLYITKTKQWYSKPEWSKIPLNLPIDWKTSKEIGKRVYHLNEHTNGYIYRWRWYKRGAHVANVTLYKFLPVRQNKRKITQLLKKGVDYWKKLI